MLFFAYAAAFRLGSQLVVTTDLTFPDMFKVMSAMVFGAMAIGQNQSIVPDYAEAKEAANRIFLLFSKIPKIDSFNKTDGFKGLKQAKITASKVEFTYPSRQFFQVLKGIDLSVYKNKTVALVGQSGCGKSTMFGMFQRFYDYDSGRVDVGNVEIPKRNVADLRHHYGLVQQEPVLFKVD
jgi:ABC-type multidrug transport system fused ATPase/permease subunit